MSERHILQWALELAVYTWWHWHPLLLPNNYYVAFFLPSSFDAPGETSLPQTTLSLELYIGLLPPSSFLLAESPSWQGCKISGNLSTKFLGNLRKYRLLHGNNNLQFSFERALRFPVWLNRIIKKQLYVVMIICWDQSEVRCGQLA